MRALFLANSSIFCFSPSMVEASALKKRSRDSFLPTPNRRKAIQISATITSTVIMIEYNRLLGWKISNMAA